MARIFKMTYGAAGRATPKFYGEFRDLLGRVRRVALSENERESANALDNLIDKLARAKRRWLVKREDIDPLVRKAFHKALRAAGHPDAIAEHTDKPLLAHLDEFEQQLSSSGGRKGGMAAKRHVESVIPRIRAAFDTCGFVWSGEIRIDKAKRFLSGLQVSSATRVKYAQAVKQFTKWLVHEGRIETDPLAHLERGKFQRERDRRAFSVDECQRLIGATQDTADEPSPIRQGMPGAERAVLYTLALEAGLRRNELRTLTWIAFALDADQPTVTIAATNSKHRERDVLPLKASTVLLLLAWRDSMDANGPKDRVFPHMGPWTRTGDMVKGDLAAARAVWLDEAASDRERTEWGKTDFLEYVDHSDRVGDFHALRHTFITNLARGGVHPSIAKELARHSTIGLTMDHYTHTVIGEQAEALKSLPDLERPEPDPKRRRATGTADARPANSALFSAQSGASKALRRATPCKIGDSGRSSGPTSIAPNAYSSRDSKVGASVLETTGDGFASRCACSTSRAGWAG